MKKLLPLFALLVILLSACGGQSQKVDTAPAPGFNLPNALGDYSGKNVLLFFHMAVG